MKKMLKLLNHWLQICIYTGRQIKWKTAEWSIDWLTMKINCKNRNPDMTAQHQQIEEMQKFAGDMYRIDVLVFLQLYISHLSFQMASVVCPACS